MDQFLDLLMALEEGGTSTSEIAEMVGRAAAQTHGELQALKEAGFLRQDASGSYDHDRWAMTGEGRKLLARGFDEYFKKVLAQNWGGSDQSAS